jgi:rhodanese-related sulfurtransferase
MKKLLLLFVAFALTLTLAGCNGEELPELPEEVTMANVDEYLGRPDVQYVDLREFDEKMKNGYVLGFEVIPFFGYLEATDILVRQDGDWNFDAADLVSQGALTDIFDDSKTIFLMCGSGTRAGYVQAALESLDYTVYNVGGFADYDGANAVTGDGTYDLVIETKLPDVVDMTNIDMYLGRSDVQYVDLRNFDDKMKSGYIAGFEFIPFFDYLEYENILVRQDGDWTFDAADIVSQAGLRGLFDADKTIFLMCGSGTRAGYVQAALESLGYDVYNVGGIGSYTGSNMVLGDDTYMLNPQVKGDYTPGTYFGYDPVGKYMVTVMINEMGGIGNVFIDAIYGDSTKQDLAEGYNMDRSGGENYWFTHANNLAALIVENQGWDGIGLVETAYDSTWNALTVPGHIIEFDDVAGVTVGAEGFVFAWNAAIAQATDAGTLGVVATTVTPAQWAAAHAPAFNYVDGTYFGMDEAHGYYVKVVVEDGFITEVFFDALYANYVGCDDGSGLDTTVAKSSCIEANQVYEDTTKQVLGEAYNMDMTGGENFWFTQADELAEAIIDAQEWSADWVITPGATSEDHDKFDMTDADTLDAVGGVTIGIEGFKVAWEEAIAQAAPTS